MTLKRRLILPIRKLRLNQVKANKNKIGGAKVEFTIR